MILDMECERCRLCRTRTMVVPPSGDLRSPVVLVGEAPGANEDRLGRPFVGKAGGMLDRLLIEEGIPREALMITNTVKCRPPDNRRPKGDEMAACRPYLLQELSDRMVIVAMGRSACRSLLGREVTLEEAANTRMQVSIDGVAINLIPTYHPSACLFNLKAREGLRRTLSTIRDEFL